MTGHRDVVRLVKGPPGRRVSMYLAGYTEDTALFKEMTAYLGYGLVTGDGERWRRQRRVVAPVFTAGRIARYITTMAAEAERMAG